MDLIIYVRGGDERKNWFKLPENITVNWNADKELDVTPASGHVVTIKCVKPIIGIAYATATAITSEGKKVEGNIAFELKTLPIKKIEKDKRLKEKQPVTIPDINRWAGKITAELRAFDVKGGLTSYGKSILTITDMRVKKEKSEIPVEMLRMFGVDSKSLKILLSFNGWAKYDGMAEFMIVKVS